MAIYFGEQIVDGDMNKTLSDKGIEDESSIHIVTRVKGGQQNKVSDNIYVSLFSIYY